MLFSFASPRLSLKARLIWSYLVILGTGGLATSLVGSWIVSSTIMMQARSTMDAGFDFLSLIEQPDGKRAPRADLAVDGNGPARRGHDSIGDRQAEPRAMPALLGRERGIEDAADLAEAEARLEA